LLLTDGQNKNAAPEGGSGISYRRLTQSENETTTRIHGDLHVAATAQANLSSPFFVHHAVSL